MQAKISIQLIAPDKVIKQSRDLKYAFVFIIEVQLLYCVASCAGSADKSSGHEEMNTGVCLERVSNLVYNVPKALILQYKKQKLIILFSKEP